MKMKKTIALLLVLVMCLSLCACGKSEEVIAVEEKIASIGEVTIDKADVIMEANQAYAALSDEDKKKVENFDALQNAMETLHDAMFASIALQCETMNIGSDLVADSVLEVWGNVGGSDFWTWYGTILKFKDNSRADIDYSEDFMVFNMPAYALGVIDSSFEDLTAEQVQKIGDTCVELANTYYGILEMSEQANQDFVMFKDLFGEEYAEECQFLREWYLASSVFVEFATNPSGNRSEYSATLSEHNSTVHKFQKEAELMK